MIKITAKAFKTINEEGYSGLLRKTLSFWRRRASRCSGISNRNYRNWLQKNRLADRDKKVVRTEIDHFTYKPIISIIMPVYNVDKVWLDKAIESVLNQLYENWELCIVDDGSTEVHIRKVLDTHSGKDKRIKVRFLKSNLGISAASNTAISMASRTYLGILDHDDELCSDAIYETVRLLNSHPEADMIYSDEDKLDADGRPCIPSFKPGWSPDLFLACMYTCHFTVVRKSIIDLLGGFRPGFDGSQDYDLVLRVMEHTDKIYHIPKILYHWRMIEGSAAQTRDAKAYALVAARRALSDYMKRNNISGAVEDGLFVGSYRLRRHINCASDVCIIIPFRDQATLLKRCINSILKKSTYENYRILLVNNRSRESDTYEFLEDIDQAERVQVLEYDKPFNFSALNNYAVSHAQDEYILFLNNDTEVITPNWIEVMLEHAQRGEVDSVGALLYYPNDTVQHGGVILGLGGIAVHAYLRCSRDSYGYMGRLKLVNNLSAVTAACMMARRSVLEEVGGFDENITHAFNDVDLCLKIRQKNYLIVYTPYAELYHHESISRGFDDTPDEKKRFQSEVDYITKKWGHVIDAGDPYYNPNLTLEDAGFALKF